MKLYTKTGDRGVTSLYDGQRRPKNSDIFDAIGTIDELISHLGLVEEYHEEVHSLQCILFDLGAHVATPSKGKKQERVKFGAEDFTRIVEEAIDRYTEMCPPLTTFVLPGAPPSSSHLHVCRSVCRRLERCLLNVETVDKEVLKFVNRLSDLFFAMARHSACKSGNEKTYRPCKGLLENDIVL